MVTNGSLKLTISYSSKEYRTETMQQLAKHLQASLQQIIAHCVTKEQVELTPSDLLLKDLTVEELERLVEQTADIGEIENVYYLTPMQKGMFFHNLMDSYSGAYFEQLT